METLSVGSEEDVVDVVELLVELELDEVLAGGEVVVVGRLVLVLLVVVGVTWDVVKASEVEVVGSEAESVEDVVDVDVEIVVEVVVDTTDVVEGE